MCSFSAIDQNRLYPLFEPSIESSASLYVTNCESGKEEFLDSPFFLPLHATIPPFPLSFSKEEDRDGCESSAPTALMQKNGMHSPPVSVVEFQRECIKNRVEDTASESVSPRKLSEEIKAQEYRETLRTVQTFVSMPRIIRPPEASLQFHKEYIKKKLEQAASESVSTKELFEEIIVRGYQGTLRTVQTFVSMIRASRPSEASFQFHKGYIKKRVEKAASESVSPRQLFEEIRANGYLGAYNTVRSFISTIREKKNKRAEASFEFHKEYIKKRIEKDASESVSTKELLEEIKAKGYQGTLRTVQTFLSAMREKKGDEASLQFHKKYIKKRVEESVSKSVSPRQIFEEIRANGYLGSYNTVAAFLSTIRTSRAPEASLQFHKKYISKRLEAAALESVSPIQLFEEIRANGYLGAFSTVRSFVSTIREKKNKRPRESLELHKKYIIKRIEQAAPESISIKKLFEEIQANGYLGAYKTVAAFVLKIRRSQVTSVLIA